MTTLYCKIIIINIIIFLNITHMTCSKKEIHFLINHISNIYIYMCVIYSDQTLIPASVLWCSEVPSAAAVLAQRRRVPFNLPTLYSSKEWWWSAQLTDCSPFCMRSGAQLQPKPLAALTIIMSKRRKVGLWHEMSRAAPLPKMNEENTSKRTGNLCAYFDGYFASWKQLGKVDFLIVLKCML